MSQTQRPSPEERAGLLRFEEDMEREGEWQARIKNIARQGTVDGAADYAKWAVILAGLGAVVFFWRKKKVAPASIAGEQCAIADTARGLGLRV